MENCTQATPSHAAGLEQPIQFNIEVHRTDKSLTYIAHLQEINYQIGTTVHIGETIFILELFFFFKCGFVTSLYIIPQRLLCGEDKGNNEAIKTQDFSEDQNQDHAHK